MTLINCTEFSIGITDDIAVQAELRAGSHEGMEQKVRDAPIQLREVDDHLKVGKNDPRSHHPARHSHARSLYAGSRRLIL